MWKRNAKERSSEGCEEDGNCSFSYVDHQTELAAVATKIFSRRKELNGLQCRYTQMDTNEDLYLSAFIRVYLRLILL